MKLHLKFAVVSLVFVPMVVFLAYNSLSASSPYREPLASFTSTPEIPAPDFIPAPVAPARDVQWAKAVHGVLDQVEKLENRLEEYSAQLEAIEKDEACERMAAELDLDKTNPGAALENLVTRFGRMVEAYAALDQEAKVEITGLDSESRVAALTAVADEEDRLNAYFDGLAARSEAYAEELRVRDLAVCEAILAAEAAGRLASEGLLEEARIQTAGRTVEKACEAVEGALNPSKADPATAGSQEQSPADKPPAPEREAGK